MDRSPDIRIEEIRAELDEGSRRSRDKNNKTDRHQRPGGFKYQDRTLFFSGMGLFLLIVILVLFLKGGNQASVEDLTAIKARLEKIETRLTRLDDQTKELHRFLSNLEKSGDSQSNRQGKRTRETGSSKKQGSSIKAKAETSVVDQNKPVSQPKKRYYEVRPGDTLFLIAKKYGVSVDELCRLNNLTEKEAIQPGQKILIP